MAWVIILIVLLVAFGPILWLRPSRRDRRLARMRQAAREAGLNVTMVRVPKLEPELSERVTSGGRVLEPVIECAAYQQPLPRKLRLQPGWRLLRGSNGLPAVPGWVFEVGRKPSDPVLRNTLDALASILARVPEDVIGVEVADLFVAVYWLEKPSTVGASGATSGTAAADSPDVARVGGIAEILREAAASLDALERQLEAAREEGKI
ncbi:MAG: hypothetical protein R3E86_17755 [Pseudomonadales bacterium]